MCITSVKPGSIITLSIDAKAFSERPTIVTSHRASALRKRYLVKKIHRFYVECVDLDSNSNQMESFSFNDLVVNDYENGDPEYKTKESIRRQAGYYAYG